MPGKALEMRVGVLQPALAALCTHEPLSTFLVLPAPDHPGSAPLSCGLSSLGLTRQPQAPPPGGRSAVDSSGESVPTCATRWRHRHRTTRGMSSVARRGHPLPPSPFPSQCRTLKALPPAT